MKKTLLVWGACVFLFITSYSGLAVIVDIPDNVTIDGKGFYGEYDASEKFYYGIEEVTSNNKTWWLDRLEKEQRQYELYFSSMTVPQIEAIGKAKGMPRDICIFYLDGMRSDIENALQGFGYNLLHYTDGGKGSTWVAYVSTRPVKGPLYLENNFDIASPEIKMMVTVKISKYLYCPLGICRSCTGGEDNQAKKPRLSMRLHRFVADAVRKINPDVKYMVVIPLWAMKNVFMSSGLHCFVSDNRNTSELRIDSDDDGSLTLVDPRNDTTYKFSQNHWFAISPFLGGTVHLPVSSIPYPFVIIDCQELAEYKIRN